MVEPLAEAGFVPVRSRAAYTVELDGEAVILDERANRLHLLNHSAALVWACCDGHASIAELAAEISDELGLPETAVLADLRRVVAELGAEGLLEGIAARAPMDEGE